MKLKRYSTIFLILGMAFLTLAFATDRTFFSWIAILLIVVSLLTGGRWMRRRRK